MMTCLVKFFNFMLSFLFSEIPSGIYAEAATDFTFLW